MLRPDLGFNNPIVLEELREPHIKRTTYTISLKQKVGYHNFTVTILDKELLLHSKRHLLQEAINREERKLRVLSLTKKNVTKLKRIKYAPSR